LRNLSNCLWLWINLKFSINTVWRVIYVHFTVLWIYQFLGDMCVNFWIKGSKVLKIRYASVHLNSLNESWKRTSFSVSTTKIHFEFHFLPSLYLSFWSSHIFELTYVFSFISYMTNIHTCLLKKTIIIFFYFL
jgi:hypothetical protein